jgi:hypothetical protein
MSLRLLEAGALRLPASRGRTSLVLVAHLDSESSTWLEAKLASPV